MKKPLLKRGVAVFDLHFPHHNKEFWENILLLLADLKPDYFLFGGDNMDMTTFSHWIHDKGEIKKLEGRRIKEEYEQFNEQIINPLNEILTRCEKHFLLGNHEMWAYHAIERNPQGEGYWEPERNINLKGWKVYQENEIAKIGKLHFIHGVYTNDAHAKKHVLTYECNIIYGHLHDHQSYTKITPVNNEPHIGISVPCACHKNPDYMRNKPSKWINGLFIFDLFPDGTFTPHVITATNNRFSYGGKVYG